MQSVAIFSLLVAAVAANPILLRENKFIPIRSMVHEIHGESGVYSVQHESGEGTIVQESGSPVLPAGALESGASKTGQFSWTSPEGQSFALSYVADENGFRPTGTHLPVPPPMPEEIRSMLPTLPRLVEVERAPLTVVRAPLAVRAPAPAQFVHRHFEPSRVLVQESAPLLIQEPAPVKTFVQTNEFLMDSSPAQTMVRIGQ